jgi:predicted DNA-binding protein (UPF0251 family)/DNA-directed RNA polymerase subunit RPC12/RpoP
MPRPHKCRLIAAQPPLSAFKPAGVPGRTLQSIALRLDELEALRLADLEGLYHDAAAQRMGISRPTFGRLLVCARHKVACALFQSKMLLFNGGPVVIRGMRTFECAGCGARFGQPRGTGRPTECPQCHSRSFCRVPEQRGRGAGRPGPNAVDGASPGRGRCCRRRAGWSRVAQTAAGTPAAPGSSKANILNAEEAS